MKQYSVWILKSASNRNLFEYLQPVPYEEHDDI